jgi:hypothetical protein
MSSTPCHGHEPPASRPTSLTPLKALRAQCLRCMGQSYALVRECPSLNCPAWRYRMGFLPKEQPRRPLAAIRAMCVQCGSSSREARKCTGRMLDGSLCVLHLYRIGKNPSRRTHKFTRGTLKTASISPPQRRLFEPEATKTVPPIPRVSPNQPGPEKPF